ncbi:UPF0052 domain protein [Phialemonium atrogriseum]|uniref:UPF0052 domain protein n=1 Tax=Phialemonium atrogriseum TaxID=1093897 RepID=A0AAJ0C8M7_9PEZI|nr:UPF0052 domain protein [Phialemonium atrogriseum]KAK1770988.1 UPF0052 domain protein [Phialemonium atrogriseum]
MDRAKGTPAPKRTGITVFSGGTGGNSLVDVFNRIIERRKCQLNYIIPISDNGGSSSELIRFIGGPSVGDVRSRLVRLIPNHEDDPERTALKALFEYRLCRDGGEARTEWLDVVEGRHPLWAAVSSPKRELIRSVLNTLNLEIVKRARPTSVFNFAEASIGNMFLTGARLFSGSFESAIYLLSMICAIPTSISVLPAINSNFTHHICAGLEDGTQIAGQVAISHPAEHSALPDDDDGSSSSSSSSSSNGSSNEQRVTTPGGDGRTGQVPDEDDNDDHDDGESHDQQHDGEDANLPGSLPALGRRHVGFTKDADRDDDLPARVSRLWYINPYGHEIWPAANPKAVAAVAASHTVVYSVGSLYTSIVPSVVLGGIGAAIADPGVRKRVLVLNSGIDRETGPRGRPMGGRDFVAALARAGEESRAGKGGGRGRRGGGGGEGEMRRYVTHLIYLRGKGAPAVDEEEMRGLGIECVRVAAAGMVGGGEGGGEAGGRVLRYDEAELGRALEAIMDS